MSKLLSIKIDDDVLKMAERFIQKNRISRNAYINQAVQLMNRLQKRRLLRNELRKESHDMHGESQAVLREFEGLQDEGL